MTLKKQLLTERQDLVKESKALFADDRDELNAKEQERDEEIAVRIEEIDKQLDAIKRHEARARGQADLDEWMAGSDTKEPAENKVEGFTTFGQYLQAVYQASKSAANTDRRLYDPTLVDPKLYAASGASSLIDKDGSFLVQTSVGAGIREKMFATGQILSRIDLQPIGANFNSHKIYMVDEQSRANGSRFGGVRAYWTEAGGTITSSKPSFEKKELKVKKVAALVYADDELLEDAVALESFIQRKLPEELRFVAEDAIYEGTGAGMPLGVLNAACTVEVAAEGGQAAATVLWENIQKMWSRTWAPSRANAVWHINQDIEPQLFGLVQVVGTGGVPVYLPANGASGQPYSTLMGRPIIPIEYCSTLGTVGDIMLCDWSQYAAIDKGAIKSASSMHVQFITDEMAFRFTYRIDGHPTWTTALTPFKGTNTLSPFVKLETRS